MQVPGSNILNQALQLIAAQQIGYMAFVSRNKTSTGTLVPIYARTRLLRGSIQPVPRNLMQTLGLDMQRNYVNIFVPNNVIDIKRDISSDKFSFAGNAYQGISSTAWFSVDGWNQMLAVQVPS